MEFVDRIEEQPRLIKTLNCEKPTFIVVYGRANGTCPPNQFVGKRGRSGISGLRQGSLSRLARVEMLLPLVDDNTPANDKNAVELTVMSDIVIAYEKEHCPIEKPTVAELDYFAGYYSSSCNVRILRKGYDRP